MKYIELFAGIGGFRLGIERVLPDAECVFSNEWDKYAAQTYNKNFGGNINVDDIRTVTTKQLGDHELLVGGFPCQAFSVAGKRAGFYDTRGTLFFEVARILRDKRPRHLVLENVKGLLNHDGGKTFAVILGILADLGYRVEWQVLNSKDFGVPQVRERTYIVGHLRDECRRKILPILREGGKPAQIIGRATAINRHDYLKRVYSTDHSSHTLPTKTGGGHIPKIIAVKQIHNRVEPIEGNHSLTLDSNYHKGLDNHGQRTAVMSIDRKAMGSKTRRGMTKVERIGTLDRDQQQYVAIPVLTPDRSHKAQNGRQFKEDGEPMFTINSSDKHGIYDGVRIRSLTPLETERCQAFPDDWTAGVSDSQRYKQTGNAVTVSVVEAVMSSLHEVGCI